MSKKLGYLIFFLAAVSLGIFSFSFAQYSKSFSPPPDRNFRPNLQEPNYEYKIPVLVLRFLTDADKNGQLDPETRAKYSVATAKSLLQGVENKIAAALEKGSIYHGYRNANASSSLHYTFVERKNFSQSVPRQAGEGKSRPADHQAIFTELGFNICDYVDNKGIKEIWIWMPHNDQVHPIESFQVGSLATIKASGLSYPRCQNTYTVYNYTLPAYANEPYLERFPLHNHMHHLEAISEWVDKSLFSDKFAGVKYSCCPQKPEWVGTQRHCGNTHNPPNSLKEYDYQNYQIILSDCENWKPEGGAQKNLNCQTWGKYFGCKSCSNTFTDSTCTEVAYYVWWMQNLPGKNNGIIYQGKEMFNFWSFIGDFDQAANSLGPRVIATPTSLPTPQLQGECRLLSIAASDQKYASQIQIVTIVTDCPTGHEIHLYRNPSGWTDILSAYTSMAVPFVTAQAYLECGTTYQYCAQAYNPATGLLYGPEICDNGSTASCP
ncbi:MAG: hypothetical protein ABIB61_00930 [Candidatus Shapirobacteria bacterium]